MKQWNALFLPLLIALMVPMHVLAENPGTAFVEDVLFVSCCFLAAAVCMLALGYALWRDIPKAGVFAAGMLLLLGVNIGFRLFLQWIGFSMELTRNLLFQGALHVFWFLLLLWIVTRVKEPGKLLLGGTLAVALFLLFDVGRIAFPDNHTPVRSEGFTQQYAAADSTDRPPDIVMIVLDGHARQDVLKELYGVDNGRLIEFLRSRNFYVADRAFANYPQTQLSMTAMFSMEYIDPSDYASMDGEEVRRRMSHMILREAAHRKLKAEGYHSLIDLSWQNTYHFDESVGEVIPRDHLVLYETAVWEYSSRFFFEKVLRWIGILTTPNELERFGLLVKSQLSDLPAYMDFDEPVFVFCHIISPHPPFVLGRVNTADIKNRPYVGADASHHLQEAGVAPAEYRRRYASQVVKLDELVMDALDQLIKANSDACIILMSDHGPGSMFDFDNAGRTNVRERFPVLSAYRVPGAPAGLFYPDITPVNTFRRLFSYLFDTDSSTVPDRAFLSTWKQPLRLYDVTEKARQGYSLEH
ncbi:LTA synthase family protein [bacterium]|nr:LTA synthase family protein [bacterium]